MEILIREQKIVSIIESGDRIFVDIQYHAILAVALPDGMKAGDAINIRGKSEYIFRDELIYSIIDDS